MVVLKTLGILSTIRITARKVLGSFSVPRAVLRRVLMKGPSVRTEEHKSSAMIYASLLLKGGWIDPMRLLQSPFFRELLSYSLRLSVYSESP